jgi:hypothetical protein
MRHDRGRTIFKGADMTDFRLPARVQPQLWVNDNAMDTGPSIEFDAHDAMLGLDARYFARVSEEILNERGHDYDDLALNSGVIDEWLADNREGTFYVDVEDYAFAEWLQTIGVTELQAIRMTDELLSEVRERLQNEVASPASAI